MLVKYKLKEASKYTGFIKASEVYFGGYYLYGDAIAIVLSWKLTGILSVSYDVKHFRINYCK